MYIFNVGDKVHIKGWYEGTIVAIDGDIADVEYTTPGGGGCLPFELSELEHIKEKPHYYRVETLIGTNRFSCNCYNAESALDALAEIFTEFPRYNRSGVDFEQIINEMESGKRISYNVCPICITRMSGEM